jgi:sigma-B regulation protein RsbU (phosphoserine phosphatase)
VLLREGSAQLLEGEGRPLGIMEGSEFFLSENAIKLASGDRLVLYTDGLTDVMTPDGRLSDRRRFMSLLELHSKSSPAVLCQEVFQDLLAIEGESEQYDDMAMLILGVKD